MKDLDETKLDRLKHGTKKLFGRTNERFKQRIGRSSDPTAAKDEKWAIHVANFNRQQASGQKLHREVKGYIASLKTLENSTQTLLDAVREMHEYTWPGNMNLVKALQSLDQLNRELNDSMVDNMLVPINNYMEVFPDVKDRMNKRERKKLDYTRCKRSLDTVKKGDKISQHKLGAAQEDYSENKLIFDELNNELCEDLPDLFNSRKPFISKFLDGFFRHSMDFHKEFAQVYSEAFSSLEPLKETLRKEPVYTREIGNVEPYFVVTDGARKFKRQSLRKSFRKGSSFRRSLSMGAMSKRNKDKRSAPASMSNLSVDPYVIPAQQATPYTSNATATPSAKTSPPRPKPPRSPRNEYVNDTIESETDIDIGNQPAPVTSTPTGTASKRRSQIINDTSLTPFSPSITVEPGTLVECIHEYTAVDDDELTFVTGDIISVVAWDSTDEQDEGWFMGIIKNSGAKGAFPINYTREHIRKEPTPEYDNVPDNLQDQFENVDLGDGGDKDVPCEVVVTEPPKKKNEYMNLPPDDDMLFVNGNHGNGTEDETTNNDNNADHHCDETDDVIEEESGDLSSGEDEFSTEEEETPPNLNVQSTSTV